MGVGLIQTIDCVDPGEPRTGVTKFIVIMSIIIHPPLPITLAPLSIHLHLYPSHLLPYPFSQPRSAWVAVVVLCRLVAGVRWPWPRLDAALGGPRGWGLVVGLLNAIQKRALELALPIWT